HGPPTTPPTSAADPAGSFGGLLGDVGELVGVADGVDAAYPGAVGRQVDDHDGVRGVLHEQHRGGLAVDLAILDVHALGNLGDAGDEDPGDVVAAVDGAHGRLAAAVVPER